jgi:hypothetical protein
LPIKNKWSTINNTTIYAFNIASKDNVNPCESYFIISLSQLWQTTLNAL